MNVTTALPRLGQLLAVAIILTGSHAFGQSVITTIVGNTETQSYSFTGQGPGTIPVTFSTFDTSAGATLDTVTLEYTGVSSTGNATIYNTSAYPVMFGGSGGAGYNEDLTGGFKNTFTATSSTSAGDTTTVLITSNTQTMLAVPPGTSPTYAGNNFTTGTLTGSQSPDPQDFAVTGDLSNYAANGSTTITISLAASTSVIASGNAGTNQVYVAGNASALADGTFNLIYTFTGTPVPEPSKTAAIMIGFALCVLVGRNYLKGRRLALA